MENYIGTLCNSLCLLCADVVFVTCQIPFIAMYRKENCSSLFKDLDANEQENEEDKPNMRCHKVANYSLPGFGSSP